MSSPVEVEDSLDCPDGLTFGQLRKFLDDNPNISNDSYITTADDHAIAKLTLIYDMGYWLLLEVDPD